MKKRLMCLVIAVLMILPLVLSSCGDEMTPEEVANANFQMADKALTLSLWLPTDAVTDDRFNTRLQAVEAAINDYLRSNNYSTELEIVAINEAEYYTKLSERFAEIRELEKTEGAAYLKADKYVNHAVQNEETQIYEMAYPDVLNTQLDIFFVGGYDNYISYIKNGDTYGLNKFFTEGQVYNGLFKKIRSVFMDATKVDGTYYAIPNNHIYVDNGQYILVNKELFDSNSGVEWDESFDLYSLQDYITKIGTAGIENVVPYVGTTDDIPGVVYLDKDNLIAGSVKDGYADSKSGSMIYEPEFLYDLDEYKSYMTFYKTLNEQAFVASSLEEGKTAAVQVVSGNGLTIQEYEDDYYIIEATSPYASMETMYSSMFAISSHSADYERSMQILYLLQDNDVIRTLLQYGVEEVDYDIKGEGDNKTLHVKDSGYKMNMLYTGNCYRTYPDNGQTKEYWEDVKELNLQALPHPYLSLETALIRGSVSAEDVQSLNDYIAAVASANKEIKAAFDNMSLEEFKNVFSALKTSLTKVTAQIEKYQENLATYTESYEKAVEAFDNATTEEEKAAASADMEKYSAKVTEAQEKLDELSNLKVYVEKFANLADNINIDEREDLLDLYNSIYNSNR